MPKVLTQSQIQEYQETGFLSPIDVMSEHEALQYKARLEEAEAKHPEHIHAENRNNAHLSFVFLDELAHHPVVLDVVEDLLGVDFTLWASVLFIKEPSSSSYVSWHQDATYMGMNKNTFLTPWIALSPSNLETGCMSMIPGSHHNHIVDHEDTFAEDNILTRGQRVNNVDESQAVHLILKPGQMSVHHCEAVHGSQPNKSSQRRIGFALQSYMQHDVRQTIGLNQWMHCRGEKRRDDDLVELRRPRYDLDPLSMADREAASKNYADILYNGAKQRRLY
ncbi:MAG: phytanoyl-CoA dioxygenase family protein [Granulosicoccus sp.]